MEQVLPRSLHLGKMARPIAELKVNIKRRQDMASKVTKARKEKKPTPGYSPKPARRKGLFAALAVEASPSPSGSADPKTPSP